MSMKDYWDIVREVIDESDVVIEVLDARMPHETRNRKAEILVKTAKKPIIFAVTKSDLIRTSDVNRHRQVLEKFGPSVFVSSKNRRGITFLKKKIFEIGKKKSRQNRISVGVIGYPNVGKSSLINALAGKKKAKVSPKPGWTKGVQWISGGPDLRLLDTPGVIPFSDKDEKKQILIGSTDFTKVDDPEGISKEIIDIFLKENKKNLEEAYSIKVENKRFPGIIREIGKVRNMVQKGGKIDNNRVYMTIINDWQRGKLNLKK